MSDPDALTDWVEDEYDPQEETPLEFVKGHEFPNAAAGAIALQAAERIRKEHLREHHRAEDELSGEGSDSVGVVFDVSAGRLREPSGRFIGWVEAAVKYIRRLGRF